MRFDVSIIIPACNEEKNVEEAISSVQKALKGVTEDFEIIVVDDGSTDKTGQIVDELARKNNRLRVIHHRTNMGYGKTFKDGLKLVKKTYVSGFPGDNDMSWESLHNLFLRGGEADIVFNYMTNTQVRTKLRRFLSRTFVIIMNVLFGLKLHYFNGYFVCRTKLLKSIPLKSNGIFLLAEFKIRLLKLGASYREIPFKHSPRLHGKSKTLNLKSFINVVKSTASLFRDIYLSNNSSAVISK